MQSNGHTAADAFAYDHSAETGNPVTFRIEIIIDHISPRNQTANRNNQQGKSPVSHLQSETV